MKNTKVWFVTGASKGLGLALVKQLLKNGNQVAATSRSVGDLAKAVSNEAKHFLPLEVDLTNESSVQQAIEQTIAIFGKIDVVVNNADYALVGSFEKLTDQEVRQNFDIYVFGILNVIRKVLPYLRKQSSGHIFNVSSVAGYVGDSGQIGNYNATKFAVVGLSETLAADVKPFSIYVTVIVSGAFRTNFANNSSLMFGKNKKDEYQAILEAIEYVKNEFDGKQNGDPKKAALAIIRTAEEANPPIRLLLGPDAYKMVLDKLVTLQEEFDAWKEVSCSTDFEE